MKTDRRKLVFRAFLRDDRGAVTVDYVVLASLIIGLSIAIAGIYRDRIVTLASDMSTELAGVEVTTTIE